jgi:non-heme chloroperoxidase
MPYMHVAKENSTNIDLYFEDHGSGDPVVLIHGWPLSGRSWERQVPGLLMAGNRVITYDRRGFGQSSQPSVGYDYDSFAADLHMLITKLDLKNITLVGFSMGGGEVARYIGTHGTDRVAKAVFISAIPPYLLKTDDNPEGVDGSVFEEIKQGIVADRPAFLAEFLKNFYSLDKNVDTRISQQAVQLSWDIASIASPIGTLACVDAWLTDFRADLKKCNVPTLVIHGDDDRIVPFAASGKRTADIVKNANLALINGAPHGLNWTHAEEMNSILLDFIAGKKTAAGQKVA